MKKRWRKSEKMHSFRINFEVQTKRFLKSFAWETNNKRLINKIKKNVEFIVSLNLVDNKKHSQINKVWIDIKNSKKHNKIRNFFETK